MIIQDFFPTILEMAGVEGFRQIGGVIDGLSFTGLLRGEHDAVRDDRPLFWHYPNHWGGTGPGIAPSSTVRHGDWKLIYYHADGRYELFNLADDLGEYHDLSDERSEVRDRLADELGEYLRSVDAQMPVDKRIGENRAATGRGVVGGKIGHDPTRRTRPRIITAGPTSLARRLRSRLPVQSVVAARSLS